MAQNQFRWKGFRKVHKQVCKRLKRRMAEIDLKDFEHYKQWILAHKEEWDRLDQLCRITISRFYRDRGAFDYVRNHIIPKLLSTAKEQNRMLQVWSAGCASGEEPYTLSLILQLDPSLNQSEDHFKILATDIDPDLIDRAQLGCYGYSSIKDLPEKWLSIAFELKNEHYCIQDPYKDHIDWKVCDIREHVPEQIFDLICCRNLVATYFKEDLQTRIFSDMSRRLRPGSFLMLGIHESLPLTMSQFEIVHDHYKIYRKRP